MKIGAKLLFTYFILLIIVLSVTAASFHLLSQRYLIGETRKLLQVEAKFVADLFQKTPLTESFLNDRIIGKQRIEIANRYVRANIIILNKNKKVIYSDIEGIEGKEILRLLAQSNILENRKEYVSVRAPISTENGEKGYVVLFTKVKDIKELNTLFRRTQILSLIIAGLIALLIGWIMERHLTKPLKQLMDRIKHFSLHDSKKIEIETGDEIEELAISFQQMAEKLKSYDEQQKIFLQNASHELKTPLMAIQGNAEAIKDGVVEGPEINDSLDVIIEESQRLKKIVEEIIYLTKLENVEETFHFQTLPLQEILHKAVKSVKALAEKKGIEIELVGNTEIMGSIDKEKLERALINIIGNGIRYAKKKVAIAGELNVDEIVIRIMDDGNGFRPGEENRVFDRFYKGENGGTGIGLAITKAIIEAHQGQIEAFNREPHGAVFLIKLPAI